MKFKRLFGILAVLATTATLSSCGYGETHDIINKEYSFTNCYDGYDIKSTKLNTYYIDGGKTAYVKIDEFINNLNGFLKSNSFNYYMTPFSSRYNITWTNDYTYRMTIDYKKDTISFNIYSFFENVYSSSTTNFSYGLKFVNQTGAGGGEHRFYMNGLFDIHEMNDEVYVPFCIANLLFCSQNYYNIYFNGDEFYGVYIDYSDYDEEIVNKIKTSSLNNTIADSDLRLENYNMILFALNNFYGLGNINGITDYDKVLPEYIKNEILSTNPDTLLNGYKDLMYYLDDPHTSLSTNSFYNDPSLKVSYDKSKYGTRLNSLVSTSSELKAAYGDKDKIQYYDNTALIHFTSFNTGSKKQIYDEDNNVLPTAKDHDSYYYMKYVMEEIENHGGIDNIILDVTLSPGGNIAALYRVLGFLTDKNIETSFHLNFGDILITEEIALDTNLDGSYTDKDSYSDYNWTIMTSNYTYSAANTLVAISKKLGIKQIGEKTGGGQCSIIPIVLPDGASFYMSGMMGSVVATSKTTYYNIEYGLNPDIEIERSNLYNMQYLDNILDENTSN